MIRVVISTVVLSLLLSGCKRHGTVASAKPSTDSGEAPLVEAALNGDLIKVRAMLERDPSIVDQQRSSTAVTALHVAAKTNNVEMMKLLIRHRANIQARNSDGATPLHAAAYEGSIDAAKILLEQGADVSAVDLPSPGEQPLYTAVKKGHIDVVQLLIAHGADVNAYAGGTPLEEAAVRENLEMMQLLLKSGAKPRKLILHRLAHEDWSAGVALLIENGANINELDELHCTPLCLAAEQELWKFFDAFLQFKPDVNVPDNTGATPLHWVAVSGTPERAEKLLALGARKDLKDRQGLTPLAYAQQRKRGPAAAKTRMLELLR